MRKIDVWERKIIIFSFMPFKELEEEYGVDIKPRLFQELSKFGEAQFTGEDIITLELDRQFRRISYDIMHWIFLGIYNGIEKSLRAPTPPAIRIIREDAPPYPSPRLINEDKPSVWSIIKDAWRNFHKGITK